MAASGCDTKVAQPSSSTTQPSLICPLPSKPPLESATQLFNKIGEGRPVLMLLVPGAMWVLLIRNAIAHQIRILLACASQRYWFDVGHTQAFITEMLHGVAAVGRPVRILHEYRNTTATGNLLTGAACVLFVKAMLQYIEYSFSDRAR